MYTAIRIKDGYEEEFEDIIEFCQTWNLKVSKVKQSIKYGKKLEKWKFKKEDK